MAAAVKNLTMEQGADFWYQIEWLHPNPTTPGLPGPPYDLTGASARMQVREAQGGSVLLDATSANGSIALGSNGVLVLHLSAEQTTAIATKKTKYDLEVVIPSGGAEVPGVYRLLQGSVLLSPNITQDPGEPIVAVG